MYCPKCGKNMPDEYIHCPQCGCSLSDASRTVFIQQKEKSGCGKKISYGLLVLFGVGMLGAIADSANGERSSKTNSTTTATAATVTKKTAIETRIRQTSVPPPIPSSYSGNCGIEATAHLASHQYINHPHLRISVRNVSGKGIAAIKFYAIPYDVYGEDISSSIFSQNRLQTDDLIPAGRKKVLNYGPFMNQSMKSVKLYVYSIYFEDGSEWGDREATRQEILKYGKLIEATFQK